MHRPYPGSHLWLGIPLGPSVTAHSQLGSLFRPSLAGNNQGNQTTEDPIFPHGTTLEHVHASVPEKSVPE